VEEEEVGVEEVEEEVEEVEEANEGFEVLASVLGAVRLLLTVGEVGLACLLCVEVFLKN
jgi:hypothetical protein